MNLVFILIIYLEIIETEATADSRYIVMASDGVWEFLDSNKIMSMVNPYFLKNDPEGAVNYIINESTMWWEKVHLYIFILLGRYRC